MLPSPLRLELRAEHPNHWPGLSRRDTEGEKQVPPRGRQAGRALAFFSLPPSQIFYTVGIKVDLRHP